MSSVNPTNPIFFPPENNPFIFPPPPPPNYTIPTLQDYIRTNVQNVWGNSNLNRSPTNPQQLSVPATSTQPWPFPSYPVLTPTKQEKLSASPDDVGLSKRKIEAVTEEELNEIINEESNGLNASGTIFTVAAVISVVAALTLLAVSVTLLPPLFPLSFCLVPLTWGISLTGMAYYEGYRNFSFHTERLMQSEQFLNFIQDPDKVKLLRSRHFEPLVLAYNEELQLEHRTKRNEEEMRELREKNAEKVKTLIEQHEKEEKELQESLDSKQAASTVRLDALNKKIAYAAHNPYL
ncbi:MAG TPA: hypothetical protein VIH61_01920 [Waddliaceae bacterium]